MTSEIRVHPVLKGPAAKIDRASEHVLDLNQRIKAFGESKPYEFVVQVDPNGVEDWLIARRAQNIPDNLQVIVGEVIYNLRSALDQMVCAVARKAGAENVNGVYFPFGKDRDDFESKGEQRKIRKLPTEAQDLIHRLQPYKGGNDVLWSMNRLGNVDKHQTMLDVGAMGWRYNAEVTVFPAGIGLQTVRAPKVISDPFADEIKLLGYPSGRTAQHDVELSVDVAFRNVEVVGGFPVVATLVQYIKLVGIIFGTFQYRFFPVYD